MCECSKSTTPHSRMIKGAFLRRRNVTLTFLHLMKLILQYCHSRNKGRIYILYGLQKWTTINIPIRCVVFSVWGQGKDKHKLKVFNNCINKKETQGDKTKNQLYKICSVQYPVKEWIEVCVCETRLHVRSLCYKL